MNSGWSFFGARATKVIVSTSRQYNASLNTCKKSRQLEEEVEKKSNSILKTNLYSDEPPRTRSGATSVT